jgi:hypothetical protein
VEDVRRGGQGVALRTTVGRLQGALLGEHRQPVVGSLVNYVNYSATFIPEGNVFSPYVYKRMSFAHEHEYRLLTAWHPNILEIDEERDVVTREPDVPPMFRREELDLGQLIEAVYVSPDAAAWVAEVVVQATHMYLPGLDVRHSDLEADPVY